MTTSQHPACLPLRGAIALAVCQAIDAALPEAQAATRRTSAWIIGTAPICCLKPASRHLTSGFWEARRSTTRLDGWRPAAR
ncbi:MAG TPA: hypothetical protein VK162_05190 [Streptosporangiaceae bacterium]|nr:hypothetical protein [Streptosporangiaceae bacterium]